MRGIDNPFYWGLNRRRYDYKPSGMTCHLSGWALEGDAGRQRCYNHLTMDLSHFIQMARGDAPADLVLKGGKVVNVFSGEVYEADVAIADGHIVGLGTYAAQETIDVSGKFLAPGFIAAHVHIESSMAPP